MRQNGDLAGAAARARHLWRLLWATLALLSGPAHAAGTDCPLAHSPYSSNTPLIDLALSPATKAILDRDLGDMLAHAPPDLLSPTPPTFAAILSPRAMAKVFGAPGTTDRLARLDADLARVPVTPAATRARCARYDETPPPLPRSIPHPALLVFDKINGFRDGPSVDAATAAFKAIAAARGWTLVFSENGAVFNARDLARFDAVIWNNVSGDALTVPQERAFRSWIEQGGGFVGVHGAGGDPLYLWDWYADALIGARFTGHPMSPQFQAARVSVDDSASAITRGLGGGWTMTEEWYSFAASPRRSGAHVLATLDEATYSQRGMGGEDLRMGDHPIAWTRCLRDGRSFYSAIGHRPESYDEPHARAMLERGIAWAAGLGETRCRGGREVAVGRAGG